MLPKILALVMCFSGPSDTPSKVCVNVIPFSVISTYSPTDFRPDTLGSSPNFEITDSGQIKALFQLLSKEETSHAINPSNIRVVLRFSNATVFIDREGVVKWNKKHFQIHPDALDSLLGSWGHPNEIRGGFPIEPMPPKTK